MIVTPTEGAKGITGKGYSQSRVHSGDICSRSVLDDMSRLEILIGRKRAGNNSFEIINEAADICQLLFKENFMDIKFYRGFIDELIDDYHSD